VDRRSSRGRFCLEARICFFICLFFKVSDINALRSSPLRTSCCCFFLLQVRLEEAEKKQGFKTVQKKERLGRITSRLPCPSPPFPRVGPRRPTGRTLEEGRSDCLIVLLSYRAKSGTSSAGTPASIFSCFQKSHGHAL